MDAEEQRLHLADPVAAPWRRWGPYLSERQWGTVREDYSDSGDAWSYFPHDHARSRAYRWGEDGIAGICDEKQRLCLALAVWNGRDPILKERMFGLTNSEGNHGEDVKEYYFYLDSTPTHSYMRFLYKYPQAEFPYNDLMATNRSRHRQEFEYELLDTGVFDDDRYFDVFVEYAKAAPDDILMRVTVWNRGPDDGVLHLLPTLWFRNTWSWRPGAAKPELADMRSTAGGSIVRARHAELGSYLLHCDGGRLLFTENETNTERLFGTPNRTPYVKDGIGRCLIDGDTAAVNPAGAGTKVAVHYALTVAAGQSATVRLRLTGDDAAVPSVADILGPAFDQVMDDRAAEADTFYAGLQPTGASDDEAAVLRQALAGMLWTKQYYYFDVEEWLAEHRVDPWREASPAIRNHEWFHMITDDILSMPDKWEYPWFAAWDLAFHAVALAVVDVGFAKQQLELLLRDLYLHPNGQIPAYEWNFSDVNPPVHAWATYFIYVLEERLTDRRDLDFLESAFQKLLLNFTWWVNRKDPHGRNVFQGGFLGLDNIGVFDRSAPLPTGGQLEQADGTAWMALYCQSMLQIALELTARSAVYGEMAVKFAEHFLWISAAMNRVGEQQDGMWDEEDGFFYDVLRRPDGSAERLRVRSMVGLLPLCAATVFQPSQQRAAAPLAARVRDFVSRHPALAASLTESTATAAGQRSLLSVLDEKKLRRVLARLLDDNEFLGEYGVRSLSRHHLDHPYVLQVNGQDYKVGYLPAESDSGMFGGNSNWRGPVWFPVNALVIRALLNLYAFYGDEFTVECPTGSGKTMTLFEVSREIARRLVATFLSREDGRRPVYGGQSKFQTDPHWHDLLQFYEYFHGDNGAGIGASHQTGWTGLVGALMILYGNLSAADFRSGEVPLPAKPAVPR